MRPSMNDASWRTASYSNSDDMKCVEVGGSIPGAVPVRDTKDRDRGILVFPPGAWQSLTNGINGSL